MDKQWVFIEETSSPTVRYKASRTESSTEEESCDYSEQVKALPATIPSKDAVMDTGGVLEIYDDHFLSSSSEDSDIEVVLKLPETISLSSQESLKIIEEALHLQSRDFQDTSKRSNCGNEEEDSEVEVLGKSIHESPSLKLSCMNVIAEVLPTQHPLSESTSECEDYETSGEGNGSDQSCEDSCYFGNSKKVDEDHLVKSFGDNVCHEVSVIQPLETNGVRISALVLTACLSVTVGIYIGYCYCLHIGPIANVRNASFLENEEDRLLRLVRGEPLRADSSPSINESLKGILSSYRKLQRDYDVLLASYDNYNERTAIHQSLSLKEMKNPATESKCDDSLLVNLTRNLNDEQENAAYWRRKYVSLKTSPKEGYTLYDEQTSFTSLCNCFKMVSNLIPPLNISALSMAKPASELTDQIIYVWNQVKNCWKGKEAKAIHPRNRHNIDRFRKIFTISNVVNSWNTVKRANSNKSDNEFKNTSAGADDAYAPIDPPVSCADAEKSSSVKEENHPQEENSDREFSGTVENLNLNISSKCILKSSTESSLSSDVSNIVTDCHSRKHWCQNDEHTFYCGSMDEFHEFLQYRNKCDILKSQYITELTKENEKQLKRFDKKSRFLELIIVTMKEKWRAEQIMLKAERRKSKNLIVKMEAFLLTSQRRMGDLRKGLDRVIQNKDEKVKTLESNVHILESELVLQKQKSVNFHKAFRDAERRRSSLVEVFNQEMDTMNKMIVKERRYFYSFMKKLQSRIRKERIYYANKLRKLKKENEKRSEKYKQEISIQKKKLRKVREEKKERGWFHKNGKYKNKKVKKRLRKQRKERRKRERFHKSRRYDDERPNREKQYDRNPSRLNTYFHTILKEDSKLRTMADKVERQEAQIKYLSGKMKMYRKVVRENKRLKQMASFNVPADISRHQIRSSNSKAEKLSESIHKPPDTHCYKQACKEKIINQPNILETGQQKTTYQPFVNLDATLPDFFKRQKTLHSSSDAILPQLYPSPPLQSVPEPTLKDKFFDLPSFYDDGLSLNKSMVDESEEIPYSWYVYWGKGRMEFNEHSLKHEKLDMMANWYVKWMRLKDKDRGLFGMDNYPSKAVDNWFVRLMKERERQRTDLDD